MAFIVRWIEDSGNAVRTPFGVWNEGEKEATKAMIGEAVMLQSIPDALHSGPADGLLAEFS